MRQLGKIKCLDQIVDNSSQWVILFHGFGADAYDLQSLSEVLIPPSPSNWLFPQGILEVPIGPGWTGRAWWNIDLESMQKRQQQGEADLSNEKPEGLPKARTLALEMIAQMKVNWSDIILAGFSQGAMLATDLFLHAPQTPKGLMILSGALINKEVWKPLVSNRKDSSYFLCHGVNDAVLPYRTAQQLEGFLNGGGMKGRLHSFQGGHEIPPEVITKANAYLKGLQK